MRALFLLLLLSSFTCFAQKSKSPPPPLLDSVSYSCAYRNKLPAKQRMNVYPFSIASKVLVVSFQLLPDSIEDYEYIQNKLPVQNDTLCYSQLREVVVLSKQQADSLTSILYNVGFKSNTGYELSSGCYNPHHAIVFLDKRNKVAEYIELCFTCHNYKLSSTKVKMGDVCDEKYDLLRLFFRNALGIKVKTGER